MLIVCASSAAAVQMPLDLSLPLHAQLESGPSEEARTRERLVFIEERLEDVQLHGQLWQYGWLGIHGGSMVYSAVDASTGDDDDDRLTAIVGAAKSAIGVGSLLLRPLPARLGADPVRDLPAATPEGERLRVAEELLESSATRAQRKYTLRPHLEGALVNLVGGAIILAFGEAEDAAWSTGLGLATTELQIWTVPDQPSADRAAYRNRFGAAPDVGAAGWHVIPRPNGLALALRF